MLGHLFAHSALPQLQATSVRSEETSRRQPINLELSGSRYNPTPGSVRLPVCTVGKDCAGRRYLLPAPRTDKHLVLSCTTGTVTSSVLLVQLNLT